MSDAAGSGDPSLSPSGAPVFAAHLPGLVLVPTPIGNLSDLSARAIATLRAADLILCEDTRVTSRLCTAFDIRGPLSPLHEHNEAARIDGILARLAAGDRIALVSDAGMPLLSDPGFRLVRAAIAGGHPVHGLPGPNAATLALILSGLPPYPYLFAGFLPPRSAARRAALASIRAAEWAGLRATLIWHEAPHRLAETLGDCASVLGDRPAAVARELTKRFEEVRRDGLAALAAHYGGHEARGEITLVVGPAPDDASGAAEEDDAGAIDDQLRAALATGASLKEAVATVTARTGLPRKQVYAAALALPREES